MSEINWRAEAIWLRFMGGQAVQLIADRYALEVQEVEDVIRDHVRVDLSAHQPATQKPRGARPHARKVKRSPRRTTSPIPPPTPRPQRRVKATASHEQALKALQHGEGTVRELATRARLNGEAGYQSMWWALKTLVTSGQVEKHGPRYRLVRQQGSDAA